MPVDPAPRPEMGLRARQKRKRRDALVDAAQRLVDAHGLDGVSVEDICAEAGVSRRTFFNYFASKDDAVLVVEPWEIETEDTRVFLDGGPTGDLREDLVHLVTIILEHRSVDHERVGRGVELAQRDPRLGARQLAAFGEGRERLLELISRRLDDSTSRADVGLIAMTTMTIAHNALVRWESAGRTGPVTDHIAGAVEALRALLV